MNVFTAHSNNLQEAIYEIFESPDWEELDYFQLPNGRTFKWHEGYYAHYFAAKGCISETEFCDYCEIKNPVVLDLNYSLN